ncbi:MAG: flagellar basal body rod protein FlgB [Thalassobaculales bacterium]
MDLNKLTVFQVNRQKTEWLNQRQRVLSENVANADTPGYTARDLKPISFDKQLARVPQVRPAVTSGRHIEGAPVSPNKVNKERPREFYEVTPSGNAVVLEDQMLKVSETQTDHAAMTNLYRKQLGLLKTAIGRSGGQ